MCVNIDSFSNGSRGQTLPGSSAAHRKKTGNAYVIPAKAGIYLILDPRSSRGLQILSRE